MLSAVIVSLYCFPSWKIISSSYVIVYISLFSFFLRSESISLSYHIHRNYYIINAEWQGRDLISWSLPYWETERSLSCFIRGSFNVNLADFGETGGLCFCLFSSGWVRTMFSASCTCPDDSSALLCLQQKHPTQIIRATAHWGEICIGGRTRK